MTARDQANFQTPCTNISAKRFLFSNIPIDSYRANDRLASSHLGRMEIEVSNKDKFEITEYVTEAISNSNGVS